MATVPQVLIVDEDPEERYRARELVREAGFEAGGEAGLGTEAVALAAGLQPDVVLCALREPVARALQTIEAIVHDRPETPLVAYADSGELALVRQAMLAGARDFVQTPLRPEELRRSLAAALESEERRRLREAGGSALGPLGMIVTVFGAKGGAGKTTVSTNLGVALARGGARAPVLVDADDTFGDAAAGLGLRAGLGVIDALRDGDEAADVKRYLTYHDSGLALLAAPASPFEWRSVEGARLADTLRQLARHFDIVLVDTASTLGEVSLAALEAASIVLWVTSPDFASAHDSIRALQALHSVPVPEERIRVVLNVTSPEMDVSPRSLEEALGRPIFWTVPYDRNVRRSTQLGRSVVEAQANSPAAASFVELAQVISGAPPAPRRSGLLARLLGRPDDVGVASERWQEAVS